MTLYNVRLSYTAYVPWKGIEAESEGEALYKARTLARLCPFQVIGPGLEEVARWYGGDAVEVVKENYER